MSIDPTFGITPSPCPFCGYEMDAASAIEGDARPKPGDLSLCIRCGAILRFDVRCGLEPATDADIASLDLRARINLQSAQRIIREEIRLRGDA